MHRVIVDGATAVRALVQVVVAARHAQLADGDPPQQAQAGRIDGDVGAGELGLPGGDLTVHHIFARRVLADVVDNPNDANSPTNYALLSRSSNSEFGDKRPEEVLGILTPDQRKHAAVQFFGDPAGDKLKPSRYEEFCEWRGERLAESINDWLGMD